MKRKHLTFFAVLFALLFILAGCTQPPPAASPAQTPAISSQPTSAPESPAPVESPVPAESPSPSPESAKLAPLTVRTVDVKHGDCILLLGANGEVMVIDTGEDNVRPLVREALDKAGITRIDILLLTHPHTDHIGNAAWIIGNYPIGEVHMAEVTNNTKAFEKVLDALEKANANVLPAKAGYSFTFAGAKCEYIGPVKDNYKNLNNSSAVMRMTYGDCVFLFAADMELEAEADLLAARGAEALKADFLKVGHHSEGSTSQAFAEAVRPQVAVVSMKSIQAYSKPQGKLAVHERLRKLGAALYRTDVNGDIDVICDGQTLTVETVRHEK